MSKYVTPSQLDEVIDELCEKNDDRFEKLVFKGTLEEWNALSPSEQAAYNAKAITNDTVHTNQVFGGATSQNNGSQGLVPGPHAGDQNKALTGDGNWTDLHIGDITALTTTIKTNIVAAINELVTSIGKRLNKFSENAGDWDTTPTNNSNKPVTSGGIYTAVQKCETLILTANSVSALPYTFSNAAIETDMVCINSVLSNPSAQLSDWTVNTDTAGQATVSGTISGSTNMTLYMMKSR